MYTNNSPSDTKEVFCCVQHWVFSIHFTAVNSKNVQPLQKSLEVLRWGQFIIWE